MLRYIGASRGRRQDEKHAAKRGVAKVGRWAVDLIQSANSSLAGRASSYYLIHVSITSLVHSIFLHRVMPCECIERCSPAAARFYTTGVLGLCVACEGVSSRRRHRHVRMYFVHMALRDPEMGGDEL